MHAMFEVYSKFTDSKNNKNTQFAFFIAQNIPFRDGLWKDCSYLNIVLNWRGTGALWATKGLCKNIEKKFSKFMCQFSEAKMQR